jgi:hypothetical protein
MPSRSRVLCECYRFLLPDLPLQFPCEDRVGVPEGGNLGAHQHEVLRGKGECHRNLLRHEGESRLLTRLIERYAGMEGGKTPLGIVAA